MANELTVQHSIADLEKMAIAIASSGLFGMKKKEEAMALMLIAQAEGRHPATVALDYDIIQGRPALKSQTALRRFIESGGRVEWILRTDAAVSAKFTHPANGEIQVLWNMDRAKAMGLDGRDNWKKQPMVMLTWRCVAEGVRLCNPACLSGHYLVEEVQDFDPPAKQKPIETASEVVDEKKPAETKAEKLASITFQEMNAKATEKGGATLEIFCNIVNKFLAELNKTTEELSEGEYTQLVSAIKNYKPEAKK